MDKSDQCSVIVCSCEAYKDLWYPFFYCLRENWKDLQYPLILSTESSRFEMDGLNIITYSIFEKGKCVPWSERLIATLNKTSSKYVILLLDDFLLESPVKTNLIETYIKYLDENDEIASFQLKYVPNEKKWEIDNGKFRGFSLKTRNAPYLLCTQASIWRRDLLLKCLRKHESIWQYEGWGSLRCRRFPFLFYKANTVEAEPFDYAWGRLVAKGKYYRPDLERIEKKTGLKFDTKQREVTDFDWFSMPKRTFKETLKHYVKISTYLDVVKSLI